MTGRPLAFALAIAIFSTQLAKAQDPPPQPPGVDVQARGPVHEAFAQPSAPQPTQGPVIAKQPPAPIDEVPPDQKPEGDNVQWIPGYWAWEDDASQFIWVSGCWRVPPPGQRWMPGHWQEVASGWVWVSGFWAPDAATQVQYLPPPPPTLDKGPSTPAPDATSVYVPGTWVYVNTGYRWRPGFWNAFRPDWIWTPACYVWTPSGCIFIDGYWDHPLDQRGFLFSPIHFDLGLWAGYGRPYVPQFVVQTDFLVGAMFVRLANRHFYFGDYFEPQYERGYVSWLDYHPYPRVYDPAFAYYRHLHAGDPRWEPALRELYTGRRGGEIPRPPRTLAKQYEATRALAEKRVENAVIAKNLNLTHLQNSTVLAPVSKINSIRVTNLGGIGGKEIPGREMRAVEVNKDEQERALKAAEQTRTLATQRRETELKMLHEGNVPVMHTDPPKAVRLETPRPLAPVVTTPILKPAPPRIEPPAHEERPIPKYEPVRPLEPRRKQ
jgi:hypothetical protein